MNFLQSQQSLHIQASTELAVIKVYRQMLSEMSPDSIIRDYYQNLLMESQVSYAEIMRKLTESYIPFEYQLPNVKSVAAIQITEDLR